MSALFALTLIATLQTDAAAADLADAKCVGAMSVMSEHASDADKPGLQSVMMFYLGKIIGRSGKGALAPAMRAAGPQIDALADDALGTLGEQCADQFSDAVDAM
jgi:hypothetical protein